VSVYIYILHKHGGIHGYGWSFDRVEEEI
jgi:hypothetical protein